MSTVQKGFKAHGSSCLKSMHVLQAHVGRKHKACAPKGPDALPRRKGTCTITAGDAPQK